MKRLIGSIFLMVLLAALAQLIVGFTAPGDENWVMGDLETLAVSLGVSTNPNGRYEVRGCG